LSIVNNNGGINTELHPEHLPERFHPMHNLCVGLATPLSHTVLFVVFLH
jgi:hypothetical protein